MIGWSGVFGRRLSGADHDGEGAGQGADRGEGRSGQTGARNLSDCFCLGRGRGRVDDGATSGGRRGRAGGADRRRLGGQSHRRQDLLDGRFGLDEGDEAQGTAAGVADPRRIGEPCALAAARRLDDVGSRRGRARSAVSGARLSLR